MFLQSKLKIFFFFPLLDTTLVFYIFGSPEGYNSHEVMFLLAVHSPSGGVPNGTSEIHAQDDL